MVEKTKGELIAYYSSTDLTCDEYVPLHHTDELLNQWGRQQSIAFYEWARVYNMSHMTEYVQAGKLPTVEELWEKYEQQNKQS